MDNKKILVSLMVGSSLILTGCFNSGAKPVQTVEFDGFVLEIDADFQPVPSGLIENKQILNKVIKSFKIPNDDGFDENLVITRSAIDPKVTTDQFQAANTDKLRNDIVGYTSGTKESISFSCGDQKNEGVYLTFSVNDTFYEESSQYFIHQYQFVANESGYIVSYATTLNEKEQSKAFKKILTSITCKPVPTTNT